MNTHTSIPMLAQAFMLVKVELWDGVSSFSGSEYICHTLSDLHRNDQISDEIYSQALCRVRVKCAPFHSYESTVCAKLELPIIDSKAMQQHRQDLLDTLIEEC